MTRKRFIKLLMSHGIPRNKAVKIAADYNSRNVPYDKAYSRFMFSRIGSAFRKVNKSFAAISTAACICGSTIKRATQSITNGIGRC